MCLKGLHGNIMPFTLKGHKYKQKGTQFYGFLTEPLYAGDDLLGRLYRLSFGRYYVDLVRSYK